MNRVLLPLLKFVAVTVPLTWLWLEGGRDLYHQFFVPVAHPILVWFGAPNSQLGTVPQRFISFVPFLGLMILTPGLSRSRRFWGTLIGIGLLFLSHVAFVFASVAAYTAYGETPRAIRAVFPVMLMVDAFPFLVWAVVAREVVADTIGRVSQRIFADTDPGKGKADKR